MKNKLIAFAFLGLPALLNFQLAAVAQPVATTLAATGIGPTNATLNGTVNPEGAVTTTYFQYGLTTNYGNLGGFTEMPATNTAFTLPGLVVNSLRGAAGANWTGTSAPAENWFSIASSADGTHLAAVVGGNSGSSGGIYTSTNSGVTWTLTSAPVQYWFSIACSADGTRLAAAAGGAIYTSTNSGATWTQTSASNELEWYSIAASADGLLLAAVAQNNGIYTSPDGGVTWTHTSAPSAEWYSVASSADGKRLAAVAYNSGIYISTNSGVAWTLTSSPSASWWSIASSADGLRLAAVVNGGGIYYSTDGGGTWAQSSAPTGYWQSIASSADGLRLATLIIYGGIYYSTNGGGTWVQSSAPTEYWHTIASSADGTQLAAVVTGGGIYTSTGASSSLAPATLYHYQAVGFNRAGTNLGADLTFTTSPFAPSVSTLEVSGIMGTSATLTGTVNPNGITTTAYFQYGLTTNYGSFTATNTLAANNTTLSVSDLAGSLSPDTSYHFQIVGKNSAGTSLGADLTFTSGHPAPSVLTLPVSSVTASNATLNGTVNPNGSITTAYFQYGLTTNYSNLGGVTDLPATNATLALPGFAVNSLRGAAGGNWTQTGAPVNIWFSIAASADGTRLAAVAYGGGIYTSANSGATWTMTSAPATNWWSIAASADGTRLVASVYEGGIYTSTDSGVTWVQTGAEAGLNWSSIAVSADGLRLAAVTVGAGIYTSTDGGITWMQTGAPSHYWYSIAASADGTRLAAVAFGDGIYTSANSGITWAQTSAPLENWESIAVSTDGTRLAAVAYNDRIYTSTNSGTTWAQTTAPINYWQAIATSADGTRLAAVALGDGIYASTNSGATWMQTSAPITNWNCIASSADGTRLAAGDYGGAIYTATGAAINLTPGITYHYRAVGFDSGGTSAGSDVAFGISGVPTVTTLAASGISATTATLQGTVNPEGNGTMAYFRYGLTTNYGSFTATNNLSATNTALPVSKVISGLSPGTVYHFKLVASNNAGITLGGDVALATFVAAPTVTTVAATSITATSAVLNGTVNPNAAVTKAYFRYGLTTNYGSYSATNTLAAVAATLSVSNLISGLTPGTTYHFELVASNIDGAIAGADMQFTTSSQAVNFGLAGAAMLPGGAFQFSFTNLSGLSFTVLGTTNLALPLTNWTVLGTAAEAPPGQYQFTDPQATNAASRYYCVRSP